VAGANVAYTPELDLEIRPTGYFRAAALDLGETIPMDARAYRFDIVLRGRRSTVFENRPEGN